MDQPSDGQELLPLGLEGHWYLAGLGEVRGWGGEGRKKQEGGGMAEKRIKETQREEKCQQRHSAGRNRHCGGEGSRM